VSFGVAIVSESWSARPARLAILRRPAMAGFALVVALFAARSLIRIPAWASTESVFSAQLADRPDSFRAQWHFAREARNRGDIAEANRRYGVAVSLWPYRQKLNLEAATYAVETGRLQGARDIAAFAANLHPEDLAVVRLLAATSLDLGDSTAARQTVRTGLTMHPDDDVLQRMARALNMDHE
jgi:predicted Zn-dependent protease